MTSNRSAFVDGKGTPLRIADAPMPVPGPNDITVKNDFVALNPIDYKLQSFGYMIKTYPYVLGSDVAGTVHSVGSSVTRFKVGDRVVGHTWGLLTQKPQDGAFTLWTNLPAANTALIPSNVKNEEAAVLPMAIDTAISGLHVGLGLPLPSLSPQPMGQVVVVYGASSSIGTMATQMATSAGVRVIGIASAKNHELVRSCGASEIFDYRNSNLVSAVVSAAKKSGDQFIGIFDAIASAETHNHNRMIFQQLGGGRLAFSQQPPENMPENVKVTRMFGIGEFSFPVWETFVTPALEQGKLKTLPTPLLVGNGLESLQEALERLKAGVSAQKLVVKL